MSSKRKIDKSNDGPYGKERRILFASKRIKNLHIPKKGTHTSNATSVLVNSPFQQEENTILQTI